MSATTCLFAVVTRCVVWLSRPNWWLLAGALVATTPDLLAHPPHYSVPNQEAPVALLTTGRVTYLVTTHSVLELRSRQSVCRYQSAVPIRCALATDSLLWLGTTEGVQRLRLGRGPGPWRSQSLPLPTGPAPITALLHDATGNVWVGVGGYGAYRLVAKEWQSALRIPAITSGLATADSSVWLGTNLGLHRWQHGTWTRYNEEGVANYEIPDNLVDNLLLDNGGSLWVFMSEAITVFENPPPLPGSAGHLPTVKYLGRPGNAVYGVAYQPGRGHLFATDMGLLLLPSQPRGELAHVEATTDKIETPQLLVPLTVPGAALSGPCLLHVDARQRIWLARPGEVRAWRAKDFQLAKSLPDSRLRTAQAVTD